MSQNQMRQQLPPQNIDPADHPDVQTMRWSACEIRWIKSYAEKYAHEALAAQAATIEAICKIIECAGPEAADEIADLLGYPSVEWPSDQAASSPATEVDAVPYATLQEVDRFFSGRLAELGSLSGEATDLHACVRAALQASRQPQAQQGGGAAMYEALRMGVECLRNWKILHPEDFDELDERAVALLKAALATKEPK